MRFFVMLAVAFALSGCHLIFPFGTVDPDSSIDAGIDADVVDGINSIDMSTDGWVADQKPKPDKGEPNSDMLLADGSTPDALTPDGPKPDSLKPCSLTCLHGGTCKVSDGGVAYCDCPTGYAGATCNMCATTYCGYTSGTCQLKPIITKIELVSAIPPPYSYQTNQTYPLKVSYQNTANMLSGKVVWYNGCGLYSNDLGTVTPNNPVTGSPHSASYTTPTKTLTYPGKAKFEITLSDSGAGKSDCTVTDTTFEVSIY